jgi:peptidoglycan/LPS O-acetylase OafA/YrhL
MVELKTVRMLMRSGKVESKLRIRLIILLTLSILFGISLLYTITTYRLSIILFSGFASFGFLIGLLFLFRISPVKWDEKKEVITLGKIDVAAAVMFVLYCLIDFVLKDVLSQYLDNIIAISAGTYAVVFGCMFGRFFGTIIMMYRVHQQRFRGLGK